MSKKKQKIDPGPIAALKEAKLLHKKSKVEEALEYYAAFLKNFFSKKSLQITKSPAGNYIEEILDSFDAIADIVIHSRNIDNKFAKAAAIYQFCHKFVIQYQPLNSQLQSDYIAKANAVESNFAANRYSRNKLKQSLAATNANIKKLEQNWQALQSGLEDCQSLSLANIDQRAKSIKDLYRSCNDFFLGNGKQQGLLEVLIEQCLALMPSPPPGYDFAICAFGSAATRSMTPFSDLEYMIIVNRKDDVICKYLTELNELLSIKIINLGHTHLRSVGLEVLNDFRSSENSKDWFFDELTKPGFRLDSARSEACATPPGRIAHKGFVDFELINTTTGFITDLESVFFKHAKHIGQSLLMCGFIYGDKTLFADYKTKLTEYWGENKNNVTKFLQERLATHLDMFSIKLEADLEGQMMNVKQDIFRICDRIIITLANLYGVFLGEAKTVWLILEGLEQQRAISAIGAKYLKQAMAIALELRLLTYINNNGQHETIIPYEPAIDHLSNSQAEFISERTYKINETSFLERYFLIMREVQKQANEFDFTQDRSQFLAMFNLSDNPHEKGLIYARFLQYKKAFIYFQIADIKQQGGLELLLDLALLSAKIGKDVNIVSNKIIQTITKGESDISCSQSIKAFMTLALLNRQSGKHKSAIAYYLMALEVTDENENHFSKQKSEIATGLGQIMMSQEHALRALDIFKEAEEKTKAALAKANILHNMGVAYSRLQRPSKALELLLKALAQYKQALKESPNHQAIGALHNNLGAVYKKLGLYDKAIEHLNYASKLYDNIYKEIPNHPRRADIAINKANVFNSLGELEAAGLSCDAAIFHYSNCANVPINRKVKCYNNMAINLGKRQRYEKAIEIINSASDLLENTEEDICPQSYLQCELTAGYILYKLGKISDAEARLLKANSLLQSLEINGFKGFLAGQVYYCLAIIALGQNNIDEAAELFNNSLKEYMLCPLYNKAKIAAIKAAVFSGQLLFGAKKLAEAEMALDKVEVSQLGKGRWQLKANYHHQKAQIFERKLELQKAILCLEQKLKCYEVATITTKQETMLTKKAIGYLALKTGQYKLAREHHLNVLEYYKQNNNSSKVKDYRKKSDISQICHLTKLYCQGDESQLNNAKLLVFDESIRQYALNSEYNINKIKKIATSLYSFGLYQAALDMFRFLRNVRPDETEYECMLASCQQQKDNRHSDDGTKKIFIPEYNTGSEATVPGWLEPEITGMESHITADFVW